MAVNCSIASKINVTLVWSGAGVAVWCGADVGLGHGADVGWLHTN